MGIERSVARPCSARRSAAPSIRGPVKLCASRVPARARPRSPARSCARDVVRGSAHACAQSVGHLPPTARGAEHDRSTAATAPLRPTSTPKPVSDLWRRRPHLVPRSLRTVHRLFEAAGLPVSRSPRPGAGCRCRPGYEPSQPPDRGRPSATVPGVRLGQRRSDRLWIPIARRQRSGPPRCRRGRPGRVRRPARRSGLDLQPLPSRVVKSSGIPLSGSDKKGGSIMTELSRTLPVGRASAHRGTSGARIDVRRRPFGSLP